MQIAKTLLAGSLTLLCGAAMMNTVARAPFHSSRADSPERARVIFTTPLPKLDGNRLKAILVEVHYGPGESSAPHTHPCPVIGYVLQGAVKTQVNGEAEAIYKPGESFYEPPGSIHQVSANASATEPANLVAIFVCDHEAPLSTESPAAARPKGN